MQVKEKDEVIAKITKQVRILEESSALRGELLNVAKLDVQRLRKRNSMMEKRYDESEVDQAELWHYHLRAVKEAQQALASARAESDHTLRNLKAIHLSQLEKEQKRSKMLQDRLDGDSLAHAQSLITMEKTYVDATREALAAQLRSLDHRGESADAALTAECDELRVEIGLLRGRLERSESQASTMKTDNARLEHALQASRQSEAEHKAFAAREKESRAEEARCHQQAVQAFKGTIQDLEAGLQECLDQNLSHELAMAERQTTLTQQETEYEQKLVVKAAQHNKELNELRLFNEAQLEKARAQYVESFEQKRHEEIQKLKAAHGEEIASLHQSKSWSKSAKKLSERHQKELTEQKAKWTTQMEALKTSKQKAFTASNQMFKDRNEFWLAKYKKMEVRSHELDAAVRRAQEAEAKVRRLEEKLGITSAETQADSNEDVAATWPAASTSAPTKEYTMKKTLRAPKLEPQKSRSFERSLTDRANPDA